MMKSAPTDVQSTNGPPDIDKERTLVGGDSQTEKEINKNQTKRRGPGELIKQ